MGTSYFAAAVEELGSGLGFGARKRHYAGGGGGALGTTVADRASGQ